MISLKNQFTNYKFTYFLDFCRRKKAFTSLTVYSCQNYLTKNFKYYRLYYFFFFIKYKKLCLTLIMCNKICSKQKKQQQNIKKHR